MKIVNIVLAIGTAFILGALITLGIKAFYPEPVSPTYPNLPIAPVPLTPCATKDVECQQAEQVQSAKQQADQQAAQSRFDAQEAQYESAMRVYNRNVFIVANVIGIIVFVVGFFLVLYAALTDQGAPIGMMLAGLWSILYGYGRGWDSIDDRLKFFVGLVVAVLVIGGSMWLMQRRSAARRTSA
ncbi:MAG TPA: hypothetical protein VMT99_01055 [Candidatus Paceibacterota bacterium]|nr:hypothetical protein [Candidatus Paceibacterota bacterium]